MREDSPEQMVKRIERQLWVRKALPLLLADIAISALISDPYVASIAHKEAHALDSLPHD